MGRGRGWRGRRIRWRVWWRLGKGKRERGGGRREGAEGGEKSRIRLKACLREDCKQGWKDAHRAGLQWWMERNVRLHLW